MKTAKRKAGKSPPRELGGQQTSKTAKRGNVSERKLDTAKKQNKSRAQSPRRKGRRMPTLQVLSQNKSDPLPTRTDFDVDFVPVDGVTRRARRAMIERLYAYQNVMPYPIKADPFVAQELRQQERRGGADEEALRAILGKKANWRDELVLTAITQKKKEAIEELRGILMSSALTSDWRELRRIAEAIQRSIPLRSNANKTESQKARLRNRGAKFMATLYGLRYELKHGQDNLPTRDEAKAFLQRIGLLPDSLKQSNEGKNDHRFFTKPYLARFRVQSPWGRTDGKVPITPR